MKINKTKKSSIKKSRVIIISVIVGVLLLGTSAYALIRVINQPDQQEAVKDEDKQPIINLDPPSEEQIKSADKTKEDSLNQDTEQQPTPNSLSLIITAKSVNASSSTLQIRTLINSIINNGTCNLTLSKGDSVVNATAGIQPGPSDSTCQGFDIPLSRLSTGTWKIKIDVTSGNSSGSVTSEVDIDAI